MPNLFIAGDFDFFKSLLIEAGELANNIQNSTLEVRRKRDESIVTQADQAVQDLLIERITNRYDNYNFIYEENYSSVTCKLDDSTITAIIDPIDGTAMFSMRLPFWCISIGIFKGYQPLYGFVYAPGTNMFFYNDDRNAYLNDEIKLVNKDMSIDTESNIFHASEMRHKCIIDFPGKVRNLGSTALHACLTIDNARNRTVAFIGKSNLWDWAGAIPIILKAGGNVAYISGKEVDYKSIIQNNCKLVDYLVAHNFRNFEEIRKIFTCR
jgi:3'(2'), 5'-bisphosphate nucleotidase